MLLFTVRTRLKHRCPSKVMLVHSKTELQRWPVRADDQKDISQQLQTTLPRALYLKKMENLKRSVFESGCRDEAPSPDVLKSISWRQRMRDRKHKNETLSLQMMVEEKKRWTEWGYPEGDPSSKGCDALVKEKHWHIPPKMWRRHSVSRCNRKHCEEK